MWLYLDIERQISVRSTREDLIKRGILKEINDNASVEQAIPEESNENEVDSNGNCVMWCCLYASIK